MNVFITGTLKLGSQLYSQCLRDLNRLSKTGAVFCTDDSSAGLLASKLASGMGLKTQDRPLELAVPASSVVLVYVEDVENDSHYEERVYAAMNQEAETVADVYVRALPVPGRAPTLQQPGNESTTMFRKAFELMQRRIRPIPTKGPQIFREVEIRPNGGRPWFNM